MDTVQLKVSLKTHSEKQTNFLKHPFSSIKSAKSEATINSLFLMLWAN